MANRFRIETIEGMAKYSSLPGLKIQVYEHYINMSTRIRVSYTLFGKTLSREMEIESLGIPEYNTAVEQGRYNRIFQDVEAMVRGFESEMEIPFKELPLHLNKNSEIIKYRLAVGV